MSERTVSVTATCSFDFTIDDEAVSEWDGAKILDVIRQRGTGNEIYTKDATLDTLLGHLGIMLSVEGRTMGSFDGWADFPEDAAKGSPYAVSWDIDWVNVSPVPEDGAA